MGVSTERVADSGTLPILRTEKQKLHIPPQRRKGLSAHSLHCPLSDAFSRTPITARARLRRLAQVPFLEPILLGPLHQAGHLLGVTK